MRVVSYEKRARATLLDVDADDASPTVAFLRIASTVIPVVVSVESDRRALASECAQRSSCPIVGVNSIIQGFLKVTIDNTPNMVR